MARGGTLILARAPRALAARIDPFGGVAGRPLALMRGLKRAFDPAGILSPGRYVA
ncbi:MAG: FAD-linked oxidase C-terminal domain-containing protein [Gemmatimonadota bacterium]